MDTITIKQCRPIRCITGGAKHFNSIIQGQKS